MKYCKTQEEACVNDRRCIQVLDECDSRCNTNLTCWNSCVARAGNKNAADYFKCIIDNKCLDALSTAVALADPQSCIEEKCPNQWATCLKDPKCKPALDECEKKCGGKVSCWTLCLPGKGSQAAIDVAKCAQANNCMPAVELEEISTEVALADPQSCIEEKCPNQWATCLKDPKCKPALDECEKKCGGKVSCWTLCLPGKGSQAAIDVAKCAQANNCMPAVELKEISTEVVEIGDPQSCIEEKCPNQWAACQKDSKCVPALQDCEKKCGTKSSCWSLCLPTKGSQAAIDVAKCAQSNHCVGMVPAFEFCMTRSCSLQHANCLSNWSCRQSLLMCRNPSNVYDFNIECLAEESKTEAGFLSEWFQCAGGHFCL